MLYWQNSTGRELDMDLYDNVLSVLMKSYYIDFVIMNHKAKSINHCYFYSLLPVNSKVL